MTEQSDSPDTHQTATPTSPIFIGGQRRSGTTLMRVTLQRHPHIAGLPECHFFQHVDFRTFFKTLRADYQSTFDRIGVGRPEMDRAVAAFIDTLFAPARTQAGARRWLEKSPENIRRIDYLFRLFPDAQFIHMIRDPRDTLASMKQQAATHKPYWRKFTAEVTGPEWVKCIECGKRWKERPDQYIEVRYEDLVSEPEPTIRRVLDFLHEPWYDRMLSVDGERDGEKDGNEHAAVFASSAGRWSQDLTVEEIRAIEKVAGTDMVRRGYQPWSG